MLKLVSRNGELIAPADAHVSVFNPAFFAGFGIYESLQIEAGKPFACEEHLLRLEQSAALLELALPGNRRDHARWIHDLLAANEAADATLRILVVGPENGGQTCIYMWLQSCPVYQPGLYTLGADAITFEGRRTLPAAKALDTLVTFLARREAQRRGAHEALLYHDGRLTEGSNSNLFVVLDGVLCTAPDGAVLAGVSRDIVLKLAERAGIPCRRESLPTGSVPRWSEAFITSSSRHVMPLTRVDGSPVGSGEIGVLTRRLMGLFEEYFRRQLAES